MALISSLVAKVVTPIEGGVEIGTAYPISYGYIITAYHVFPNIDDFSHTKIYWHRNDDVKSGEDLDDGVSISEIIYQNEEYDIVIAKCDTPKHTNSVHLCSFASLTGDWVSLGYANTGQDHNKKIRLKDPAGGLIFQSLDDDWILQLESKGNASDVALWRGMSGAAVFQDSTNTLVGIIIETPRKDKDGNSVHDDRLYAVSISYLLNNCPEFKNAINFKNDIAVFLENAATLVKKEALISLFTSYDATIPDEELYLCRYLSRLPLRDFLRLIARLQKQNEKQKSALGQLVCTLLPYIFDDDKAVEIRQGIGDKSCSLVAVPYSSPVSVEMLMAKVDYRYAHITKFTQNDFVAKYRLPLPPESGDAQEANKNIAMDAYHSFAGDQQRLAKNITQTLFNREVEVGVLADSAIEEQDKIDYVKDALEDRALDEENSYYFIVDEKAVGGQDQVRDFANALKSIYPHCTVVYCETNKNKKRQELSDYRKLRPILEAYLTGDNKQ